MQDIESEAATATVYMLKYQIAIFSTRNIEMFVPDFKQPKAATATVYMLKYQIAIFPTQNIEMFVHNFKQPEAATVYMLKY